MIDKKYFFERIILLQTYFGHKIDKSIIPLYYDQMKEWDSEVFSKSIQKLIETFVPTSQVPFPLVKHFKEQVSGSIKDRAETYILLINRAMMSVGQYQSIDFGHPGVHSAIQRFGGWGAINKWTDKDWNINESRLRDMIMAALREDLGGPEYLAGIVETGNSGSYPGEISVPVKIYIDGGGVIKIGVSNVKKIEKPNKELDKILDGINIKKIDDQL